MGADGGVIVVDFVTEKQMKEFLELTKIWWSLTYIGGSTYDDTRIKWISENSGDYKNPVFGCYGTDLYGWPRLDGIWAWLEKLEELCTGEYGLKTFDDILLERQTRPTWMWVPIDTYLECWEKEVFKEENKQNDKYAKQLEENWSNYNCTLERL